MRFLNIMRVEILKVFRAKASWLFVVLAAVSPFFGFTVFKLNAVETAGTQMIINPLLTGSIGSCVLFALFTLFELDRVNKYRVSALVDAIVPAGTVHIAKVIAVFSVSIFAGLLAVLVYFPYTMIKMESFANPKLYVSAYLIFMIPAMWFGSLFAAIFYQITKRVELSFMMVAACILLGFKYFVSGDFLLSWVITNIPVFSDGFGNSRPLRMGLYNRLFWLTFLGGAWIISILCTRKYEKGIFASVMCNINKWYMPLSGVLLLLFSFYHYRNQPFFNKAPMEVDWSGLDSIYEYNSGLNVTKVTAHVKPDFGRGTLIGEIIYTLGEDSAYGIKRMDLNCGYSLYSITADGKPVKFTDSADDQFLTKIFEFDIPNGTREIRIEYGGYPMLWGANKLQMSAVEISHDNVELRCASLIPDLRLSETSVEVSIILPEHFTLLPETLNTTISDVTDNGDGTKTWMLTHQFDYIGIYSADYSNRTINVGSMTVDFFYHRNFHRLLEENGIDEVITDVFNYCTKHFGPLHFIKDNYLRLIMTSAFNFGGGALPGVSDMSETTFSIYSLADPWKGAAGMEILAHEIIHQWWGLNRVLWDDFENPAWTAEGLTVYTTYRLYNEKYGEEYGRANYVDKWKLAVEGMNRNFYRRHPEYLDILPENFAARIRQREHEVLKYSLMPLMIFRAAELVGGEGIMDGILSVLAQSNNYEQLTFQEFLDACGITVEEILIE